MVSFTVKQNMVWENFKKQQQQLLMEMPWQNPLFAATWILFWTSSKISEAVCWWGLSGCTCWFRAPGSQGSALGHREVTWVTKKWPGSQGSDLGHREVTWVTGKWTKYSWCFPLLCKVTWGLPILWLFSTNPSVWVKRTSPTWQGVLTFTLHQGQYAWANKAKGGYPVC